MSIDNKNSQEFNFLNLTGEPQEIVLRQGDALKLLPNNSYKFTGNIYAPINFLNNWIEKRGLNKDNVAVLEFDYDKKEITLLTDPENPYQHTIKGKISISQKISDFRITPFCNHDKSIFNAVSLGIHLNKFKYYIPDQDSATNLISLLQNFKANINTNIELKNEFKGNKKAMFDVHTTSDIPNFFVVKMPVFNGEPDYIFKVEIFKDVQDTAIDFWLESRSLEQLIESYTNNIFDEIRTQWQDKVLILTK